MPSTRLTDQIGRVIGDRYRLVAPIGAGASAEVFLADDVRLKRQVALKVLHASLADDTQFLRRFQREAQAAAALSHPHIVAVYDWGDDDPPFIVTEYLGGGSLRGILDRFGRLTSSQALMIGLETSRALDYAHRRGIVHRDIKPANLIFGDDQRLRIADFGLARALAEAAVTEPTGALLGTARYASPEQARGQAVDGRSDVYALALVLVEAVTGSVPFASDTTIGTLMARVDAVPELGDELGPLRKPLTRALAPDPAERPDAGELGISLMAAAEALERPEPIPLAPPFDSDTGKDADLTSTSGEPTMHGTFLVEPTEVAELDDTGHDPTMVAGATTVVDETSMNGVAVDGDVPADGDGKVSKRRRWRRRGRRRWPVWVAAAVFAALLGAGGAYALVQSQIPSHEIPVLAGMSEIDARAAVDEFGWKIERREDRKNGTEPGEVIETRPEAGETLEEGEVLLLVVSKGNELVDVPGDLVGKTRDEAVAALTEAGFEPVIEERHDEEIDADVVIALGADQESTAPFASEVILIVSSGPAPRTVPDGLAGVSFEDAQTALAEVQLGAEKVEVFSDDVKKGLVVRSVPAAGSEVPRDSAVQLEVSKGPDLVEVPKVKGMTLDEANAALEAAGLEPGGVFGPSRGTPDSTDPEAGTKVRRGATVDIYLKR